MEFDGSAPVIFAGLAVAALVVLLLGVGVGLYVVRRLGAPMRFRCPFLRRDVEVKFEEWGGHRHSVLSCSAFGRGEEIDCGAPCLVSEDVAPHTAA